jgi:tetratricopeptide (TPR) repeat protein
MKKVVEQTTFGRLALAVFVLPLLFYLYGEVMHDAVVIDPFTVPKRFEETGLTSEVLANRVGDALRQIESATQTRMRKDNLRSLHDEGSMPDVEIPGTKFGVKTILDITRNVFGIYPKHISGDVIVPVTNLAKAGLPLPNAQATVTVYVTQGRTRSQPISFMVASDDLGLLAQRTAEVVLRQINPYVLAAYHEHQHEYGTAVEIVESMTRNPSEDRRRKQAAFNLWGNVLADQKSYEEAVSKYQKAIELNPKDAYPYYNWGGMLADQKRYEEAAAKYQKAIELDPKFAMPYNGWGDVLSDQKRYEEAVAKFQKAIELGPKYAAPYNNWGIMLREQKRYEEAVAKFQKAIELDPKYALPYNNWGNVLREQKRYEEAVAKFQKAIELDPKYALPYNNWGSVLSDQKRYEEAAAKFQKAIELDPKYAAPYNNLGIVLQEQKKYEEADAMFAKYLELAFSK